MIPKECKRLAEVDFPIAAAAALKPTCVRYSRILESMIR